MTQIISPTTLTTLDRISLRFHATTQEWSFSRGRGRTQACARGIDRQGPIQTLMHFDAGACITPALLVCQDLQALPSKADHIVRSDRAPVLEAKERLRLTGL